MTVKIRPYRNGGYEVDIMIRLANGKTHRERRKSPYSSKSASLRWGRERERHLLVHGPTSTASKKEVPTLAEFAPRYIEGYAKANGLKPSTIDTKLKHLRVQLLPEFGDKRLDAITSEDVQRFKAKYSALANKTINGILGTLSTILKCALEWEVIDEMPAKIKRLRCAKPSTDFYDFDEYERLIEAAKTVGPEELAFVLLAGDAGMRAGEIRGLHWGSVDFTHRRIVVEKAEYEGQFTTPKHDRIRTLPMTRRLAAALRKLKRGGRDSLVFSREGGVPITKGDYRRWLRHSFKAAGLRVHGPHSLRHTFCSHLAMRGVSVRVIQQLAGHADLTTTQRYMHLSPGAVEAAIDMLEDPPPRREIPKHHGGPLGRGDMRETDHRPPPNL